MVPLAGIEPALLAELDFESSASTNSAIGAQAGRPGWRDYTVAGLFVNWPISNIRLRLGFGFVFVKPRPLCGAENLSEHFAAKWNHLASHKCG